MLIETWLTTAPNWRQPGHPSTGEFYPRDTTWSKLWCSYTIKCHLMIKRNELLMHATTQGNLKNVMLSERSQTQKVTNCMTSFIWNGQNRQSFKQEVPMWCSRLRIQHLPQLWCRPQPHTGLTPGLGNFTFQGFGQKANKTKQKTKMYQNFDQ